MEKKSTNHYLDVDDVTHDFGFTFTDEEEVLNTAPTYSSTKEEIEDLRNRLTALGKIFLPLLENLSKDPDKPMIRWPNRKEVLDKQIKKLKALTNV